MTHYLFSLEGFKDYLLTPLRLFGRLKYGKAHKIIFQSASYGLCD